MHAGLESELIELPSAGHTSAHRAAPAQARRRPALRAPPTLARRTHECVGVTAVALRSRRGHVQSRQPPRRGNRVREFDARTAGTTLPAPFPISRDVTDSRRCPRLSISKPATRWRSRGTFDFMTKACPKCENELEAVSKGAYRCTACAGMFVPASLVPFVGETASVTHSGEENDALGGRCPLDRTILTRTEIEVGADHRVIHLERCSSCRSVWFDRGEWSLLADHQLLENLDQVWTAEWRAQQRRQRSERDYERRLHQEFGPELFATLNSVAMALRGHERRSQALAYIRDASGE